jgi:histidine ammonia-lyase
VLQNYRRILAIELQSAAQALEFRRPLKSSPAVEELHSKVRDLIKATDEDRYMSIDMRLIERELLNLFK